MTGSDIEVGGNEDHYFMRFDAKQTDDLPRFVATEGKTEKLLRIVQLLLSYRDELQRRKPKRNKGGRPPGDRAKTRAQLEKKIKELRDAGEPVTRARLAEEVGLNKDYVKKTCRSLGYHGRFR